MKRHQLSLALFASIFCLFVVSVFPAEAAVITTGSGGSQSDPSWTCGRAVKFSPNRGTSTYYVTACVGRYASGQIVARTIGSLVSGPKYPGPCYIYADIAEKNDIGDFVGWYGSNITQFNCIYGVVNYYFPLSATFRTGASFDVVGRMRGNIFWNESSSSDTGWVRK